METIVKTANLSRAKKIFKNYATKLVKVLESKGVNMIKESDNAFHWKSFKEEGCAEVDIEIHDNIEFGFLGLFILVEYPSSSNLPEETKLEQKIRRNTEREIYNRYRIINTRIPLTATGLKEPILEPVEKVANQLCLALKCYDKISNSKTMMKIERAEKRIYKLVEKEAGVITESFFK